MKKIILLGLIVCANFFQSQKILFDATKSEMVGNADWVIDSDSKSGGQSNPQRIPTPAQNLITASTAETFWTGALSHWAIDLVRAGYTVETLPKTGKITYGDATNAQDLSNYKVFIVDEPNNQFSASEKTAIVTFVKNGGGLFMISDHTVSDRDSDGWDSPAVWNDLMSTNSVAANPFGITFDLKNISGTYANIANLPTNTILHGSAGNPSQIQYSNGTTMTLDKTKNSSATGLMYTTGSSTTGTTNIVVAQSQYGTGKVVALGDSSVPDDGTGDTGDSLYNGYTGDASGNHQPMLINAVIWLASTSALGVEDFTNSEMGVYPNPATDFININGLPSRAQTYTITDAAGRLVEQKVLQESRIYTGKLSKGVYFLTVGQKSVRFIKN